MANFGWMDVTCTCPTHAGVTTTIRVFGKHGDVIYKEVKDETNADYYTVRITITISTATVSYIIN